MIKIFTVDELFGKGGQDLASLTGQAMKWERSKAIDEVLVGYSAIWPHNFATAPYLLALTRKLRLIVAHRPGVMDPTAAARFFSTLDSLSGGGRLAVNVVSGSSEKDMKREGDYSDKATRYERATEYVELMKRCWSESGSFDHQGSFYKAEGVRQTLRSPGAHVPIYMGGDSDAAVEFGARHADLYMLWGEPIAGTKERIKRVEAAARKYQRTPQFSLSLRLFLGDSDDAAWDQAHRVWEVISQAQGTGRFLRSSASDQSVGRMRQLALASKALHDDCFWTGLVQLLGGFSNSAALVGTPDRVMQSLKQYRELGVSAFLITTGEDGNWDVSLEAFAMQMKEQL